MDDPTAEASQIQLKHDEISLEYCSGHAFPTLELVPIMDRHHGTTMQLRAIGSQFNWTLNQEVVFSAALTGKPKKKLLFSQYCWKRCVIGTKSDYATSLSKPEWHHALSHGDLLSLQQSDCRDPLIFCPANHTDYLNVAAYLEAFWGYIWPTASHGNVPPHDEWKTIKHGGLKEFIDHLVCTFGRAQLKPTTECRLRGVTTYPSGDQRQGRYNMTLTDLMNNYYTRGVREAMLDLILGRSDNIVKVGDVVEMLLGISFAIKDAMLDWEWLGIDPAEWSRPQRHPQLQPALEIASDSRAGANFLSYGRRFKFESVDCPSVFGYGETAKTRKKGVFRSDLVYTNSVRNFPSDAPFSRLRPNE